MSSALGRCLSYSAGFAPAALCRAARPWPVVAIGMRTFAAQREEVNKYKAIYDSDNKKRVATPAGAMPATVTATVVPSGDVIGRLENLQTEMFSANWADYLYLVYSVPFWESEFDAISDIAKNQAGDNAVVAKYEEVKETLDVLYQCEDIRDHLNEMMELVTRSSGFMGTGYAAEEKVENFDEHAKACADAYKILLETHPAHKPKIEQTVGHGLALFRQKHKFNFPSMHRYFF